MTVREELERAAFDDWRGDFSTGEMVKVRAVPLETALAIIDRQKAKLMEFAFEWAGAADKYGDLKLVRCMIALEAVLKEG